MTDVTTKLPNRRRGQCYAVELPIDPAAARATADLLKALADPTRLAMVWYLRQAETPVCICDFTASFDLGQPTVSHHMGRLKAVGLVEAERQGIWVYYRLRPDLGPTKLALIEALWQVATGGEIASPAVAAS
jgi:ArsR family transcriptional regulator